MADTWTTKTAMTTGRCRVGAGQAAINGNEFHVIGGSTGSLSSVNEQYSQSGDSWSGKTAIPVAKTVFGLAPIGPYIYAVGGGNRTDGLQGSGELNSVHEYNPSGNSWTSKTNLPAPKNQLVGGDIDSDKAHFIKGAENYQYSQSSNTWSTKANNPDGDYFYKCILAVQTGKLHATCGRGTLFVSPHFSQKTYEYDQSGDSWTLKTSTGSPRGSAGSGQSNNKGYITAGGNSLGGAGQGYIANLILTTQEYDPTADSWAAKTNIPGGKYEFGFSSLDYHVYAVGGSDNIGGGSSYLTTNYEYTAVDPPTFDALEDLRSFLDARWPVGLDDLKAVLEALGWSLEDLRSDVQAQAYTALEDMKAELRGHIWGLEDLKAVLDGHAQALDGLRTNITTSNQVFDGLRCELKTRDTQGPYIFNYPSPAPGQTGVPVNTNITIILRDDGWGVDIDTVWVEVDGVRYKKGDSGFSYSGTPREYTITIDPAVDFEYNRSVNVKVFAADMAGNPGLNLVTQQA